MIAGERIIGVHANQRGESRHGGGAILLELGKGCHILRRDRRIELRRQQGLMGAQRLVTSAQDKIAYRPPTEFPCPARDTIADANPRAQCLVRGL